MKKIRRLLHAKEGTSMVEVMAAFLIIVLMVAMFGRVVTLSMGILQKSQKVTDQMETFNSGYYQKANQEKQVEISGNLFLKEKKKNQSESTVLPLPKGRLKKYMDDGEGLTRYFIEVMPQTENGEEHHENAGS